MLSLQGISKSFLSAGKPLWVLRNIDLELAAGETLAVVGPSGSGKSTLLAISAGLDRPSAGSVRVNGKELSQMSQDALARFRSAHVGFVFQAFHLLPSLTALENVMVPAELRNRKDSRKAASDLLAQVGLSERAHHYPSQLSGGEQQRVSLARAFLNAPQILFADEQTGNLDEETAERVENLLFQLQADFGTTLVIATHNLELAGRAHRLLRLRHGSLDSGATEIAS